MNYGCALSDIIGRKPSMSLLNYIIYLTNVLICRYSIYFMYLSTMLTLVALRHTHTLSFGLMSDVNHVLCLMNCVVVSFLNSCDCIPHSQRDPRLFAYIRYVVFYPSVFVYMLMELSSIS